jgi:UDP-glucose:(heptosyl)LPS alpha-1,3-glucosyltransferase
MKLLFCLFKYFPFGGLQRDFRTIAHICHERGHAVHVYTMSWHGEVPPGFQVTILPAKGMTNHRRAMNFADEVMKRIQQEQFDVIVGFNKMPGLDLYYAADPCYKARIMKEKGILLRLSPRSRTYLGLEKAVFGPDAQTNILLISGGEKEKFINYYHTPDTRFHVLPPGVSMDRFVFKDPGESRREVREELGASPGDFLLLAVGSGFQTKGLDRSVLALAGLPGSLKERTRLVVIGEGNARPFASLARRYGVGEQVVFLGGREDVPRFLLGADLLLHPAYTENAGIVLLEAMVAGLPVLVTDVCGYAVHVRDAGAGLLIPSPFEQSKYTQMLSSMLISEDRETWKRNGIEYARKTDLAGLHVKAADIIARTGAERERY